MAGTALLLIDAQEAFAARRALGHPWANAQAEARIADLLAAFRAAGLPVIHVHHHGSDPRDDFCAGSPGAEPLAAARPLPGEPVVVKTGSSAFIGTDLSDRLERLDNPALVVAGGAANYCIDTSTRMAANLGHRVTVAEDALINFGQHLRDGRSVSAQDVLDLTLADLDGEFALVVPTATILDGL